MKKFLSSSALLLLLSACQANLPATKTADTIPTSSTASTIVSEASIDTNLEDSEIKIEESIHEESDHLLVDAIYPITGNASIDTQIKKLVNTEINLFKKDAPEIPKDSAYQQNTIYVSYSPTQLNDHVRSFEFDITTYTGGAHPNTYSVTRTYDLKSGKELQLSDLFTTKDYLKTLASKSKAALTLTLPPENKDMIEAGTAASTDNFKSWVLDGNNLIIIFDSYQVAPYAEGPQTVGIPFSELTEMLSPEFAELANK